MLIVLILQTFLSVNASMVENILKSLIDLPQQVSSGPICNTPKQFNDISGIQSYQNHNESFEGEITCSTTCAGEKLKTTIKEVFSPKEHGLITGDGSTDTRIIWRYLGITIDMWSKEVCYKNAIAQCPSFESFKRISLSYGEQKWSQAYNCSSPKIISPFNKNNQVNELSFGSFGLDDTSDDYIYSSGLEFKNQRSIKFIVPNDYFTDERVNQLSQTKECTSKISYKSCYGDCVTMDEDFDFVLSDNNYLGEDSGELCLDSVLEKIKGRNSAESKHLCEKFLWQYFYQSEAYGISCSAFRADINCDSIIN